MIARRKALVLEHYGLKSWHAAKEFNIGAGMIDLEAETKEEAHMMRPVLELRYDDSAKGLLARVGATAEAETWDVHAPYVEEAVNEHAFSFCEDTARRFAQDVDKTVTQLRLDIAEGLVSEAGSRQEMADRIARLFKGEETWRAERIAATESSRAIHNGEIMGAAHSGMVQGFELLVAADACPICQAAKHEHGFTNINEAQAQMGSYERTLPPIHPNCQCAIAEVLTPVGPAVEKPRTEELP